MNDTQKGGTQPAQGLDDAFKRRVRHLDFSREDTRAILSDALESQCPHGYELDHPMGMTVFEGRSCQGQLLFSLVEKPLAFRRKVRVQDRAYSFRLSVRDIDNIANNVFPEIKNKDDVVVSYDSDRYEITATGHLFESQERFLVRQRRALELMEIVAREAEAGDAAYNERKARERADKELAAKRHRLTTLRGEFDGPGLERRRQEYVTLARELGETLPNHIAEVEQAVSPEEMLTALEGLLGNAVAGSMRLEYSGVRRIVAALRTAMDKNDEKDPPKNA